MPILLILFLFFLPQLVLGAEQDFAFRLYQEGDYYRALSEIDRLRQSAPFNETMNQLQSKNNARIRPILLLEAKAAYLLQDYQRSQVASQHLYKNNISDREAANLLSLNLLQQNEPTRAGQIYKAGQTGLAWPTLDNLSQAKSPGLARGMSYLVPGSGLIYAGSWLKGLGSLALNAIFIKAIGDSWRAGSRVTAFLLFSFEMGWYFGGANAAAEEVNKNNQTQLKAMRLELLEVKF